MIDFLTGKVVSVGTNGVVLALSGVGFSCTVPHPERCICDTEVTLATYLYWHAEIGPQLFGFLTTQERLLFSTLLSASGVGPKLALAFLRDMDHVQCVQAFMARDSSALSQVSGVGKKKAEGLVLALHDKICTLANEGAFGALQEDAKAISEVFQALTSLGYAQQEIRAALDTVFQEQSVDKQTTPYILKAVLARLSRIEG